MIESPSITFAEAEYAVLIDEKVAFCSQTLISSIEFSQANGGVVIAVFTRGPRPLDVLEAASERR